MRGFFRFLLPFSCQILFITPTTQLTIAESCYLYPNFSPTAALASAKNIGNISKAWLSYFYENYDNKNADQERLEIVEDGLAAAFGLRSLRQPELDDSHRKIIKDDIETIMNVFDKTANSRSNNHQIHCNLDWLKEKHNGKSYKKDIAFHQPNDADAGGFSADVWKHLKFLWLWSEVHQRWIWSVPKTALCWKIEGFAIMFKGSPIQVIQICPKAIKKIAEHSELRQLRDEPKGSIFLRQSLDDAADTITGLLFHEMSHSNANTRDETYINENGERVSAYRLAGVKGLAARAHRQALYQGKMVDQGNPLRNADTFRYFGIVMFFADGPMGVEGRWTADWGDNRGKGEALIPPGECEE